MWWVLLVLAGCPRNPGTLSLADLPEATDYVTDESTPRSILEQAATDVDPTPRAAALGHALRLGWGSDWEERALADPSAWVQRVAVEAIAERNSDRDALVTFVEQPYGDPFARGLAAVRSPGPAMRDALAAAWPAESQPWRRAPLALGALACGDPSARVGLANALETGELSFDVQFLLEVGHTGDAELLPALRVAQDRVEEDLYLPVAAARLLLGDTAAEQPFRKALMDGNIERRLEAVDYLVQLPPSGSDGLLRKAVAEGPEVVRWYASLALAARSEADPQLFVRAGGSEDWEVRQLAVRFANEAAGGTLKRRVARTTQQVVIDGLQDGDAPVRREALDGVRRLGLVEAQATVQALLNDDHGLVRIDAAGTALALQHQVR